MEKEDLELLTKDLCSRLPYGVIVCPHKRECLSSRLELVFIKNGLVKCNLGKIANVDAEKCKPYLRTLSLDNMTWDERLEYDKFVNAPNSNAWHRDEIDWMNAHHFDYRGLIGKGLAIEAPKEMYQNNE